MMSRLRRLTDDELIASIQGLTGQERRTQVSILRHLQEMDRRDLAVRLGFHSLFDYCLRELRWAEGDTGRRIQVARTSKRFPLLLAMIRRGLLNLSGSALLAPHLSRANYKELVRSARGRRTRDIEAIVATLDPKPEPKERVRFLGVCVPDVPVALPEPPLQASEAAQKDLAAPQPAPAPVPQRVHFSFTADERLLADVERAKDLLKGKYPDPDYEAVFCEGVRMMLERIDPDRRKVRERSPEQAAVGEPRSRIPPSWVKRAVWRRDGGHCAFRGEGGRLCRSTAGLQYDHIVPWALGGRSDDPANIRLLCRTHNRLEARRSFGDRLMDEKVPARAASEGEEGPAPGESVGAAGA
jgi:5-methylcytosine-specific restriction endonuclease McrA